MGPVGIWGSKAKDNGIDHRNGMDSSSSEDEDNVEFNSRGQRRKNQSWRSKCRPVSLQRSALTDCVVVCPRRWWL